MSDVSKDSVAVPEDPTVISPRDSTFFRPPSVPPTKKVRTNAINTFPLFVTVFRFKQVVQTF